MRQAEAAICERLTGMCPAPVKRRAAAPTIPQKPNLLIDIQAKLQQANSPGFERWAKLYNLKEMAKTLLYLQENGLEDYDALAQASETVGARFDALTERTKANDKRTKEISELQKHIGAYGKTREIYAQYRKLPPKKAARFYQEHTSEILSCQAAKRYFDSLGMKKLPSIQSLKQGYDALMAENKKSYLELKQARMRPFLRGLGAAALQQAAEVYTEALLAATPLRLSQPLNNMILLLFHFNMINLYHFYSVSDASITRTAL